MAHVLGRLRHPFAVEHVTLMVRHIYGERVTFHAGEGEVAPGARASCRRPIPTDCRWCGSRLRGGRLCWRPDAAHFYGNLHRRSPFPIVYNIGDMCTGGKPSKRLAGHPDPASFQVTTRWSPNSTPRASDKVDAFALHQTPSRSFAK